MAEIQQIVAHFALDHMLGSIATGQQSQPLRSKMCFDAPRGHIHDDDFFGRLRILLLILAMPTQRARVKSATQLSARPQCTHSRVLQHCSARWRRAARTLAADTLYCTWRTHNAMPNAPRRRRPAANRVARCNQSRSRPLRDDNRPFAGTHTSQHCRPSRRRSGSCKRVGSQSIPRSLCACRARPRSVCWSYTLLACVSPLQHERIVSILKITFGPPGEALCQQRSAASQPTNVASGVCCAAALRFSDFRVRQARGRRCRIAGQLACARVRRRQQVLTSHAGLLLMHSVAATRAQTCSW